MSNVYTRIEDTGGSKTPKQMYVTLPINKLKDKKMKKQFNHMKTVNQKRIKGEISCENGEECEDEYWFDCHWYLRRCY